MADFSNVQGAERARLAARLSLVALSSIGVLACEHGGASSQEGSLEIVSQGHLPRPAPERARGTITVRGLADGALHVVHTSTFAGTRTLRLAPGLYSVTPASELGLEGFETRTSPRLQGVAALVRVEPGGVAVVSVRFEPHDATTWATWQPAPNRGALDYQEVSGSLSERAQVCLPTGDGCEAPRPFAPPAPARGNPERRVLERNPL